MSALDLLLSCAAVLLWLNWWGGGWASPRPSGIALVTTLRRAEPPRRDRWRSPVILGAILLLRALFYWQIGPGLNWMPRLSLVAVEIPFRTDNLGRMLLFSLLGFLVTGAVFYFCLLLLSAVNQKAAPTDYWQGLIRVLVGAIERWPAWLKLLLPFAAAVLFWLAVGPLLSAMGIQLPVQSYRHRLEEAALIGCSAWLSWKYVIAGVLVLHIVSTYVYLGNALTWQHINMTAQNLLRPLAWLPLRIGQFDFAPVLALVLVFAASYGIDQLLPYLYCRLPI